MTSYAAGHQGDKSAGISTIFAFPGRLCSTHMLGLPQVAATCGINTDVLLVFADMGTVSVMSTSPPSRATAFEIFIMGITTVVTSIKGAPTEYEAKLKPFEISQYQDKRNWQTSTNSLTLNVCYGSEALRQTGHLPHHIHPLNGQIIIIKTTLLKNFMEIVSVTVVCTPCVTHHLLTPSWSVTRAKSSLISSHSKTFSTISERHLCLREQSTQWEVQMATPG